MKVADVKGRQKVGLTGNGRGENRNIFGVRLASHALNKRRGCRRDDGHCGFHDQPKRGDCGGEFCREISFDFVDCVL